MNGALGANDQFAVVLWRSADSVFALIGKEGCSAARVEKNGSFACGDLRFRLSLTNEKGAVIDGVVEELGWGTRGTWQARKNEEAAR